MPPTQPQQQQKNAGRKAALAMENPSKSQQQQPSALKSAFGLPVDIPKESNAENSGGQRLKRSGKQDEHFKFAGGSGGSGASAGGFGRGRGGFVQRSSHSHGKNQATGGPKFAGKLAVSKDDHETGKVVNAGGAFGDASTSSSRTLAGSGPQGHAVVHRGSRRGRGFVRGSMPPHSLRGQHSSSAPSYSQQLLVPSMEPMEPSSTERQQRFESTGANKFERLRAQREVERSNAIRDGLIDDPSKPKELDYALKFIGTCMDMCPEFEREQREFQKNLERWETNPDTGHVDQALAVKAFHRPAAGNEQALPSDVRPPEVLVKTLDYLIEKLVCGEEPLENTYFFVRDRTRSIRQDFTLQNYHGEEAIYCHERIARYHILCLHMLCQSSSFSEQQELEQLRKVLHSLQEFYNDARRSGKECPNEAEFQAYTILVHLREPDMMRQALLLPSNVLWSTNVQKAIKLYMLAQKNNDRVHRLVQRNTEAAQNFFTMLFKTVASQRTSYLAACILENHFPSIRKGALKAMRSAYSSRHNPMPIEDLVRMLGFEDEEEAALNCENYGIDVVRDETGAAIGAALNRASSWDGSSSFVRTSPSEVKIESNLSSEKWNSKYKLTDERTLFDNSAFKASAFDNQSSTKSFRTEFPGSQQVKRNAEVFKRTEPVTTKTYERNSELFAQHSTPSFSAWRPGTGEVELNRKQQIIAERQKGQIAENETSATSAFDHYNKVIDDLAKSILRSMIREELYDVAQTVSANRQYEKKLKFRVFCLLLERFQARKEAKQRKQEKLLARYHSQQLHRMALNSIFSHLPVDKSAVAKACNNGFPISSGRFSIEKEDNIPEIVERVSGKKRSFWMEIPSLESFLGNIFLEMSKKQKEKARILLCSEQPNSLSTDWLVSKFRLSAREDGVLARSITQNDCTIDLELRSYNQVISSDFKFANVCAVAYDSGPLAGDARRTLDVSMTSKINESAENVNDEYMEAFLDQLAMVFDSGSINLQYKVPFLLICWSERANLEEVLRSYGLPDLLFGPRQPYNSFHLLQISSWEAPIEDALRMLATNVKFEYSALGLEQQMRTTVQRTKHVAEKARTGLANSLPFSRSIFDEVYHASSLTSSVPETQGLRLDGVGDSRSMLSTETSLDRSLNDSVQYEPVTPNKNLGWQQGYSQMTSSVSGGSSQRRSVLPWNQESYDDGNNRAVEAVEDYDVSRLLKRRAEYDDDATDDFVNAPSHSRLKTPRLLRDEKDMPSNEPLLNRLAKEAHEKAQPSYSVTGAQINSTSPSPIKPRNKPSVTLQSLYETIREARRLLGAS